MPTIYLDVDPATLRVSTARLQGADPAKLARQIAAYGKSVAGMPPVEVWRCKDGILMIADGMTRATRVAKLLPGTTIRVQVIVDSPRKDVGKLPTIGDVLP